MKHLPCSKLFTFALLCFSAVHVNAQTGRDSSALQRDGRSGGFFTGGTAVVVRMPTALDINSGVAKVTFQPGARTIWHAHAGVRSLSLLQEPPGIRKKGNLKR